MVFFVFRGFVGRQGYQCQGSVYAVDNYEDFIVLWITKFGLNVKAYTVIKRVKL